MEFFNRTHTHTHTHTHVSIRSVIGASQLSGIISDLYSAGAFFEFQLENQQI